MYGSPNDAPNDAPNTPNDAPNTPNDPPNTTNDAPTAKTPQERVLPGTQRREERR